MNIFYLVLIFVLGASVGSFVNVLIYRTKIEYQKSNKKLKRKEHCYRFLLGRSYCDHCKRQLKWWENIPIISYIFLKGKCRTCHSPIPVEYLIVELFTGIIFLLIGFKVTSYELRVNTILLTSYFLLLTSFLVIIFLYDLHYQIIPDYAIMSLVLLSLLVHILDNFSISWPARIATQSVAGGFLGFLASGLLASLFFLFLHLITKGRGMGWGDVKFAFFVGFLLGWPRSLIAFYIAFLTGALLGVILILVKKKKFGQTISFGPFLVFGTFVALFYGEAILRNFNLIIK